MKDTVAYASNLAELIVESYESFLSVDYGKTPEIILGDKHAYKDIVIACIETSGEETTDEEVYTFIDNEIKRQKTLPPTYFPAIHKIFISHEYFKESTVQSIYSLAHELAHGHAHNLGADKRREAYLKLSDPTLDDSIAIFIDNVLNEGYADFTMINMFKEFNQKFPEVAKYAAAQEKILMDSFWEIGDDAEHYELLFSLDHIPVEKAQAYLCEIENYKPSNDWGYCYFWKQVSDGKEIKECLLNPPKDISELFIKS